MDLVIEVTGNIKPANRRLTKSAPKWSKMGKEGQGKISFIVGVAKISKNRQHAGGYS